MQACEFSYLGEQMLSFFHGACQMGVVCAIRMQENLRLRLFSNHEDEWSQLCQSGEWLLMAPLQ